MIKEYVGRVRRSPSIMGGWEWTAYRYYHDGHKEMFCWGRAETEEGAEAQAKYAVKVALEGWREVARETAPDALPY